MFDLCCLFTYHYCYFSPFVLNVFPMFITGGKLEVSLMAQYMLDISLYRYVIVYMFGSEEAPRKKFVNSERLMAQSRILSGV